MKRWGPISTSGSRPTRRPAASTTRRSSRRRPSANTPTHSRCQVQARKGARRRDPACTASQASGPTASRLSSISIFTGSEVRCAGGVDGFCVIRAARPFPPGILALGHGLVHGRPEIVAQVVTELLAHLLHEARDAPGIVLVEVARGSRAGQGLEASVLALDGREPRHQAREGRAAATRTGGRGGRGKRADQQADAATAVAAFVLV